MKNIHSEDLTESALRLSFC